MNSSYEEQKKIRNELASCLSSYFNVAIRDVTKLLGDLLLCLDAEASLLEKFSLTPDDKNYIYALDSITNVATRLKAGHLLNQAKKLRATIKSSQASRDEAINNFLTLIQGIRSLY